MESGMKMIIKQIEDWQSIADEVIKELKPGAIITLSGPLGAGKTTFVQVLAKALGAKALPKSPTFSLIRTYGVRHAPTGIRRLIHVDAYRLEHPEDARPLNLDEERREPGTILVIEW